jgi:glycosyltransferase involved in cell wall biosynthesis
MSGSSTTSTSTAHAMNVYFCAWMVAGVRTQYENVRSVAALAADVSLHVVEVHPHRVGGLIERLPLLSNRSKGSIRSAACTLPLFWTPGIDIIWTQADTALFPFLASRGRLASIPYAISTDATTAQVESLSDYGLGRTTGASSVKYRVRDQILSYCYRHAALVLPWSRWAAGGVVAEFGVPEERIAVIPPGVDLRHWRAPQRAGADAGRLMRLLFVGADFARKGGPLLLDVFRAHLRGHCELHLVTKESVDPEADVFVYRDLSPNDPGLHHLYETCDALVLPTRADCFSLASIEAMAAGLPVITCPVGGIPEIVEDERSGWLVPVDDGQALRAAIEALLSEPARARSMGLRGRAIVEERYDATRNTLQAFDLLRQVHLAQRGKSTVERASRNGDLTRRHA